MNKKQKTILIVFAVVDIVIVAVLAVTIFKTWTSYPVSMVQLPQASCANYFLDNLHTNDRQVTFSMKKDVIYLTVSHQAGKTSENLDDAELLWSLLDQLALIVPNLKEMCQEPHSLAIQLNVSRQNATNNHMSIILIEDLVLWSQGKVSDEYLAANIKYRQMSVASD